MPGPALLPSPEQHRLVTLLAPCERWTATKAAELANRQAELARLTEQVQDLEADVHQVRILMVYLHSTVAAA